MEMFYKSKARMRVEKRHRQQRIEWVRDNLLYIVSVSLIILGVCVVGYRFWYQYIPSTIDATDGQAKVYITYRVANGDTLDGICNRLFDDYGYDRPCSFENEVIYYNHLHGRINCLQVGQELKLPKIVNSEVYEPYRIQE